MKLHLRYAFYPDLGRVSTWCGRLVDLDRIVRPQDVGKAAECKACRRAYQNSAAYYDGNFSVSLTR